MCGDLMASLVRDVVSCRAERFYCIFAWVFLMRAASETTFLRRAASNAELTNTFVPLPCEGSVGLIDDSVVVRLRSRKTRIGGETITRSCICNGRSGVNVHILSSLCPVHFLWPWIAKHVQPGSRIFHDSIASDAALWLKIALEARGVPDAKRYGLHSLRRGAAEELRKNGAHLSTILQAGGWKNSAFSAYLDSQRLENDTVTASMTTLFDLDDED